VVLLGHLQQALRRGRGSGTAALRRVLGAPASSSWATERERDEVRISRRFLVPAWIFSAKNGGLL
jgi:hypothetical protein